MSRKSYAILGTGRFANCLAKMLAGSGQDVVVIDNDNPLLAELEDVVSKVVIGDISDPDALTEIGIRNFDVVIIGSARNLEHNLMAATLCHELGCPKIIAKAASELHGKMLTRLGVDRVIYPDIDMARRLGRSLLSQSLLDYITVSEDFSIVEIVMPKELVGKTVSELNLRDTYRVNLILIKTCQGLVSVPDGQTTLCGDSILVAMGRNDDLNRFQRAYGRGDD